MVQGYVGGMYDTAAHAALAIDSIRNFGKQIPKNDAQVDFAIERVVGSASRSMRLWSR